MNLTHRTNGRAARGLEESKIRSGLRAAYGRLVIFVGLLVFGLGSLIWSGAAAVLGHLLVSRDRGRMLGRQVTGHGFRLYLWLLTLTGAFRFDLRALDALRGAGPLVIAPNHPSLLDAVMVISRLPEVTCVMKSEVIDNPIYGASARLADYIRNDDFIGAATQAVQTLAGGNQLLLFPEGTRTTHPPINKLKGGAALVAKRAAVPIQTVLIETESPFLSKGWPLYRIPPLPVCYRIRLGKRFMPPDNLGEAIAELEAYFASELDRGESGDATRPASSQPIPRPSA